MIVTVADSSQVGEARRAAVAAATGQGFAAERSGPIALVATEMATNLLKHAGGGMLIVGSFDDSEGRGLELLALDRGPGMADFDRCLADGFSTAGSPGSGLGAIMRQSDRIAVYTRPGLGTALMARFVREAAQKGKLACEAGLIVEPYPGEKVCGDGWAVSSAAHSKTLLLVDGLGHGPQAAHAAEMAVKVFSEQANRECVPIMETIHRALAPTRGAAAAIARIDVEAGLIRFVGVGNIAGQVLDSGETKRMVSNNGTAGHLAPRIREFTYPFKRAPLVVMHSDGLGTKWDLSAYPGLAVNHPSLIAGALFRDHRRGRDDASILVVRITP
jgi:anti-sigma regulatory factor (Ser/Thr protein kinase)